MFNIKRYYNRIKKSKNGRTLVANFGYLSLLQIASYVFPLITVPYLAKIIGVEGYGKIAFAAAIVAWAKTITDWGFRFTATRDVAKNRNDKEKVSEIFSNTIWAQSILMVLSFLLLTVAALAVPTFRENQAIIFISFLLIPGRIMFPEWFFQAMERMRYITILNLTSKLIFTLAVFVFIKQKSDFILQPLFTTLGYAVSGIISMYIILAKWKIKLKRPDLSKILLTIKGSTDVFINNLTPNLYSSFSIMLLGFWGGPVSNGKLDAGGKFISVFQQLMHVFSRTFFPFLSRRIDKHNLYGKIYLTLSISFTTLSVILAPFLVKLFFTPEFSDAIIVMQIMSVSVLFMSFSNIYGTNYLIIQGYERPLRNITLIGSLISFALSFPLIYYFDFIGAAITITLARGILGVNVMLYAKRIKRLQLNKQSKNIYEKN